MAKKKRDLRIPWPKPKPIEKATPEEMAFALLNTHPKRDDEWKYSKAGEREPAEVREDA
ncbi:MAG: hypothetical protein OXD50_04590 [Chloroflexi bacterium]|nr:hypothetical protein [Chloroflexota bacterium]